MIGVCVCVCVKRGGGGGEGMGECFGMGSETLDLRLLRMKMHDCKHTADVNSATVAAISGYDHRVSGGARIHTHTHKVTPKIKFTK